MDWGTFVFGAVVGGIVVLILATPTGRGVTGGVTRAAGERVEYHVRPRR